FTELDLLVQLLLIRVNYS
ncbi:unnamed protein product, partial [Rotaria sordida]